MTTITAVAYKDEPERGCPLWRRGDKSTYFYAEDLADFNGHKVLVVIYKLTEMVSFALGLEIWIGFW